jgi:hypothetical protein
MFSASLSRSYTFCPTKIHVTKTTNQFTTAWQGCKYATTTVGVAQAAFTRVPRGGNASLVYTISAGPVSVLC